MLMGILGLTKLHQLTTRSGTGDIRGVLLALSTASVIDIETSIARTSKQNSFPFVRPKPAVAMRRWLHCRSAEGGMTFQEIITDALKMSKGAN